MKDGGVPVEKAGLTKIPVVVRDYTTEEVSEIALVENLQRQNLNPIEEAFWVSIFNGYFQKNTRRKLLLL